MAEREPGSRIQTDRMVFLDKRRKFVVGRALSLVSPVNRQSEAASQSFARVPILKAFLASCEHILGK